MGEGHNDRWLKKPYAKRWVLDKPIPIQYAYWLWGGGAREPGQIGHYPRTGSEDDPDTLSGHLAPGCGQRAGGAVLISIPAGIIAATRQNTWADYMAMGVSLGGISIPNFWLGIMLILLLSQFLGWLPSMGYTPVLKNPLDAAAHLVMPAITLGTAHGGQPDPVYPVGNAGRTSP